MKNAYSKLEDCYGQKLVGHALGYDDNLLLLFEDGYIVQRVFEGYDGDRSVHSGLMPPEELVPKEY